MKNSFAIHILRDGSSEFRVPSSASEIRFLSICIYMPHKRLFSLMQNEAAEPNGEVIRNQKKKRSEFLINHSWGNQIF